ncbi:MAG: hypothetical protein OEZ33_00750 [Gammaproteobacteria bacterium]|nr:hypothetical protein [Gammaproteobacteria bacterium]MDH5776709.1 hypothetical protein [Gammaproteobacteria bacterium]
MKLTRSKLIKKIRRKLEKTGYPRLQMSFLVLVTAASGFIFSYTLLQFGLTSMWLRYLVVIILAYMIFLLLLWLWLRTRADDYFDIVDVADAIPMPRGGNAPVDVFSGDGGSFGGGGANASFGEASSVSVAESANAGDSDLVSGTVDAVSGADEFAIPLLLIVFVVSLLLSALFVIYSAPVLFAELMFDGVLAAGLYRRLRKLEYRHWLETAVRKTIWPFVLTALLVTAAGWGMANYAPGAHSIGDVILQLKQAQ